MEKTQNTQIEPVSSVMKVFSILTELSEKQSVGVTELSHKLMTSKSTVYRFLQTMKMLGFVSQEGDTDKYALTLKLFELSSKTLEFVDLVGSAESVMRKMGELTREAIHLGIRDNDQMIYVHKIDSQYNLRMQSRIGGRMPLYSTAIGKVLLAEKNEEEVRAILADTDFVPSTKNTHRDVGELLAELFTVKAQGFGEEVEENEEGLRCIAAPVYDRFGHVTAGMSISYPILRHSEEKRQQYLKMLKDNAASVSAKIGYGSRLDQ